MWSRPFHWIIRLSLDGPLFGLSWYLVWSHEQTGHLDYARATLVALGLWLGYVADRLSDARTPGAGSASDHESFYHTQRARWYRAWLAGLLVAVVLAVPTLQPGEWVKAVALGALAAGYLLLVRLEHGLAGLVLKRLATAALLATAVTIFLPRWHAGIWAVTGLLVLMNLLQLTIWQRGATRAVWFAAQFALASAVVSLADPHWTRATRAGLVVAAAALLLLQLWKRGGHELDRLWSDSALLLGACVAFFW